MKADELRNKTMNELQDLLSQQKKNLFNLRFQLAAHQLTNVSKIKMVKRDIARIKTVIKEKELGIF
jgi:large subunit ribosomal protein L29